jgi:acrylyl-CoA reductase (NADPH)
MKNMFKAFMIRQEEGNLYSGIVSLPIDELPPGDVLIKVRYSSINYKDGLARVPGSKVLKQLPMVPGIDLAGTVESSTDPRFAAGDEVLVTGFGLGVSHFGGYSEYTRVPADWIVPLPQGLSLWEAMVYGTAGFTAAFSVLRLEQNGTVPGQGPVLVTGASGGVGSIAVALLAKLGYEVIACTGKMDEHGYLRQLGASEIISREELLPERIKPLETEKFAAAVDVVGGEMLSYVLSNLQYGGSAAACGLTGGSQLATTVFPFILRGINLLGIDSVQCSMAERKIVWGKLANEWKNAEALKLMPQKISWDRLPDALQSIVEGKVRGRLVFDLET